MIAKSFACCALAVGLAAVGLLSLRHIAIAARPGAKESTFQVAGTVVGTEPRLRVKLSATNVSGHIQTFWAATPDCTNERWIASDANIRVIDYAVNHTKTCMVACNHHIALWPGETYSEVVTPFMNTRTRLGKRTIRFANYQPDLALTRSNPPTAGRKYLPRVNWSNPITLTIRKEWLQQTGASQ